MDNHQRYGKIRQSDIPANEQGELQCYALQMQNLHDQLDWARRQLFYASHGAKYQLRYQLKRGEVYEFDYGINVHAELSNRHYGVVLVDSYETNDIVVVCPLKTKRKGPNSVSDVSIGRIPVIHTEVDSIAIINQIKGLDKMRMYIEPIINSSGKRVGNGPVAILTSEQMSLISRAIEQLFVQGKLYIDVN